MNMLPFGVAELVSVVYLLMLLLTGLIGGNLGARVFILAVALDAFLFAVVCLGNVKHGETISAASWSLYQDGKWQGKLLVPVIDFLFRPWMTEHCRKSWVWQRHLYE